MAGLDLLFENARFDEGHYEGGRIHMEQLARHMQALGHRIWVRSDSPLVSAHKLSTNRLLRAWQVLRADAAYFRIVGEPVPIPGYLWPSRRNLGIRKHVIWEINATPEFIARARTSGPPPDASEIARTLRSQSQDVTLAICNTEGLADWARSLGISRVVVVPLGSDPNLFSPDGPIDSEIEPVEDELNVIWCGNAEAPWHDLALLVAAAKSLSDVKFVRFYAAGKGTQRLAETPNLRVLGPLSYPRMPGLLRSMDVGLALYQRCEWSGCGVTTSPLKLFDYLATGLRVVASPIEEVHRLRAAGAQIEVVDFCDMDALVSTLLALHEAKRESRFLNLSGRKAITDYYNWARVAKDTEKAIFELLGLTSKSVNA